MQSSSAHEPTPKSPGFPRRSVIITAILLVILVVGVLITYATINRIQSAHSADNATGTNLRLVLVQTFSGSATAQTHPFTIASDGTWRLAWTCAPSTSSAPTNSQSGVTIRAHSLNSSAPDTTITDSACGSGSRFIHTGGGSYDLSVTDSANVSWTVKVYDFRSV